MEAQLLWGADKGNEKKYKAFLSRVCEEVRTHVIIENRIAEIAQKDARKFLSKVKIGDIVYDTRHSDEVTLLEKPSNESDDCKCLTRDNKVRKCDPYSLRIIQKGNFSTERTFKSRSDAMSYKLETRKLGFRAEVVKSDNGFLLRIFGDSQEEVDEYVLLKIERDFVLY